MLCQLNNYFKHLIDSELKGGETRGQGVSNTPGPSQLSLYRTLNHEKDKKTSKKPRPIQVKKLEQGYRASKKHSWDQNPRLHSKCLLLAPACVNDYCCTKHRCSPLGVDSLRTGCHPQVCGTQDNAWHRINKLPPCFLVGEENEASPHLSFILKTLEHSLYQVGRTRSPG